MRRGVVAVAVAVLLSSCGGPKIPFQVVGKAVPVNVKFGKALPPVTVRPVPGGYIIVPQPIPPSPLGPIYFPPPPPKPIPCPKAGPLEFPDKAATGEVLKAPSGATYLYRTKGDRSLGDERQTYLESEIRQVGNIETTTDPVTNRETYRHVTTAANNIEVVMTSFVADQSQLAITGMEWFGGGKTTKFSPAAPLKIMPIPPRQTLVTGNHLDTWQSAATDPLSRMAVSVDGKVTGRARIDACGKMIDTWHAELRMHWVSPTDDYTTTWGIYVATQYGGVIVSEYSRTDGGTKDGLAFKENRTATITRVPV